MSLGETAAVKITRWIIGCSTLVLSLIAFPVIESSVKMAGGKEGILATQVGDATYYACSFQGEQTASGLKFDNRNALAAHLSYPFGTVVRVTNLENGKSVNVVVVDRGPYGKNRREGAIIDLSRSAAERLGMIREGQVRVRIDVLMWGDGRRRDHRS
jgi:rare lipoprotein A